MFPVIRTTIVILFILMLCLYLPVTASADVSIHNGNFYVSYIDVIFSGGMEPKVERVYNSKGSFKSIFGWGWGSEFEMYLNVAADGSVLFHEYGGGADVHYVLSGKKNKLPLKNISRLVELKQFASPDEKAAYRKKLEESLLFQSDEWATAVKNGVVEPIHLPVGTILTTNKYGLKFIVKSRNGYIRFNEAGKKEEFDEHGRLLKITDTNDNFLAYSYDDTGSLVRCNDNLGRGFTFAYNGQGLVTGIRDSQGRTAGYRYDQTANLVYSRDVDNNVYEFEYDNRHNITAIRYSDGSSKEMRYYSKAHNDSIRSDKERNGAITEYVYEYNEPNHQTVKTGYRNEKSKIASKRKYEFFRKTTAGGVEFISRKITDIDGDVTDTEYDQNGLPLKISSNNEVTRFAYDSQSHVTLKETSLDRKEFEYHPVVNKVTRLRITDKQDGSIDESKFSYDDKGNLLFAHNSDKGDVTLSYDLQGRIATMLSGQVDMAFTYNENSRPLSVILKGVGEIKIIYDKNGEIQKTEFTGDNVEDASSQVTSTLQRLLDIIKPAGVTLSF